MSRGLGTPGPGAWDNGGWTLLGTDDSRGGTMNRLCTIAAAAVVMLGAGACADDDATDAAGADSATTVTVSTAGAADESALTDYCAAVAAAGGEDPDFEGFFAEHPEPTLDDWAGFLPGVVDGIEATLAAANDITAPVEVADAHQDAIDALTDMRDVMQESLDAAAAGDQAAYDAAEERNQSEVSPALEEAFGEVEAACGPQD